MRGGITPAGRPLVKPGDAPFGPRRGYPSFCRRGATSLNRPVSQPHEHPISLTIEGTPEMREKCGVFGVWGTENPSRLAFFGLTALQHRGQESAGIATTNGRSLSLHVGMGLVSQVFNQRVLSRLDAHAAERIGSAPGPGGALGHNRYSTTGGSCESNAQPFVGYLKGGQVALGHNGNIVNARLLRNELEERGHAFHTTSDTEVVLQLLASHAGPEECDDPLAEAVARLRGAFSLVFLFNDRIEALRDPWGWRPLCLGEMPDGTPVVASESVSLDVVGAAFVREIEPGEIVTLSDAGVASRRYSVPATPRAHCVFEHVYFASPASRLFGRNVQVVREQLGERLHREAPVEADVVIAMPDSGRSAATGYSRASGLPYREGIIPNRYVGRTFIQPTTEERVAAVRMKLNIISDIVEGQRCIVVDDSIVRGTTTRAKMDQLRAAGAKEIHLRIASPPIRHACYFGIDFPDPRQLVAHGRDNEEIRRMLGVDTLHYISLEGLLDVASSETVPQEDFCTACYSGRYPIEVDPATNKDAMQRV